MSPDPGSSVPSDLTTFVDTAAASSNATTEPQEATSTGRRIDPYYLYLKLPNADSESFVILSPFVPVSSGNSINRLVSFVTANSDPGKYGELQSFVMPAGSNVDGPLQVDNEINRTQEISQAITFLNQQGSRVIRGSLQLIPVNNSIIYVRPFYVRGAGSQGAPRFQFVAVYTQGKGAVCAPTIDAAIGRLFDERGSGQQVAACTAALAGTTPDGDGETDGAPETPTTTSPNGTAPTTTTSPAAPGSVQALLDQAAALLNQAEAARATDLGEYQRLVEDAQELIEQARELQQGGE